MKKALLLIMVGMMSFGMLTGCGKSDEEKAADEIADHLREEAAEDGVDLDAMIQAEMDAYEEGQKEFENEQAAKSEFNAALAEKYDGKLGELKAKYDASTDPSEIEEIAKEYNELLSEKAQDYYDYYEAQYWGSVREDNYILRRDYFAKMAYFGVYQEYKDQYNRMDVYSTSEAIKEDGSKALIDDTSNSVIVLRNEDEYSNADKILIIKNGTDVIEMDTSDVDGQYLDVYQIDESEIIIIPPMQLERYVFDYSGNDIKLVKKVGEGDIYDLEDSYKYNVYVEFKEDGTIPF